MKKTFTVFCVLLCQFVISQPNDEGTNKGAVATTTLFASSNGLNILIHKNPCMHTVIASILFKTGKMDVPTGKSGMDEIIAENLINKKLHNKFLRRRIVCRVQCSDEYTEIYAIIHPKNVQHFFEMTKDIANSFSISYSDLQLCKQRIIIENKLRSCCEENALSDNLRAQMVPQTIFNEEAFGSITVDDVKKFFDEHYKNKVALITVCGDIDWFPTKLEREKLSKMYNGSENKKNTSYHISVDEKEVRNIHLENEHMRNSLVYSYFVSEKDDKRLADIFLKVISDRLFQYFCKAQSVLSDFDVEFLLNREDAVFSISLFPKKDISLKELKKLYELFVKKISSVRLEKGILDRIARRQKVSLDVLSTNLYSVHSYIRDAFLSGTYDSRILSLCDPLSITSKISEEDIRKLAEKVLYRKLISTATNQHRSDK